MRAVPGIEGKLWHIYGKNILYRNSDLTDGLRITFHNKSWASTLNLMPQARKVAVNPQGVQREAPSVCLQVPKLFLLQFLPVVPNSGCVTA